MIEPAFYRFADVLREALLLVTGDGTVRALNQPAALIFGLSRDELAGRRLAELVQDSHEAVAGSLRIWRRSRDPVPAVLTVGGRKYRGEGAVLKATERDAGPLILLRLIPRELAATQFVLLNQRIEALNQEIGRRRQVEQALDEEREWLRVTLLSIGDAVITTDPQSRVQLINAVAEQLTGWTQEEAAGRPLHDIFRIVNEQTREPAEPPVTRALREGVIVGLANHTVLIHRSGSECPIDDSAAPIRTRDGSIGGVVLVFRDVTERRRSERALMELNQSLEWRVAERTALAEKRTRELRALASELTRVEQRERRRLAVTLHDDLQQLLVAARMHLSTLMSSADSVQRQIVASINQLLEQSIDTSRSLAVDLAPPVLYDAGLAAALDWLVRWMREHLQLDVHLDVRTRLAPSDIQVSAFLLQSVRELLLNVAKHSGVREARLELIASSDTELEIAVQDGGAGFSRTSERRPSDEGFGLFSIRERMEMLGGRMDVRSAPGQGTHVRLICPLDSSSGTGL